MPLTKPRFRRDLVAQPMEVDGIAYVHVTDPKTGESFRFYDFEYKVALAFGGLAFDQVVPWVRLSAGLELTEAQLREFAEELLRRGFLEAPAEPEPSAKEADEPKVENAPNTSAAQEAEGVASPRLEAPEEEPQIPRLHPDQVNSLFSASAPAQDLAWPAEPSEASQTPFSEATPPEPAREPQATARTEANVALPAWLMPIESPSLAMTPAPVTIGPTLSSDSPPVVSSQRRRRSILLFASFGSLAGVLVFALILPFVFSEKERVLPMLRTVRVELTTVYRFFPTAGILEQAEPIALVMPTAGKLTRVPVVGSRMEPGEVAIQVEKAQPLLDQLTFFRERLAFHTQLRDSMQKEGNRKLEKLQERRITERTLQIAKALRSLATLVPLTDALAEVEAVLAQPGEFVEAGKAVVRLRSTGYRARFSLTSPEAVRLRRDRLCFLEVAQKIRECSHVPTAERSPLVQIEMPLDPALKAALGQPVRLARAVFRQAAPIPTRALVRTESSDRVWVVSPKGRVEPRPVSVGENDDESAIVVQGLDAGDVVLADPPPALSAGTLIQTLPAEAYRGTGK